MNTLEELYRLRESLHSTKSNDPGRMELVNTLVILADIEIERLEMIEQMTDDMRLLAECTEDVWSPYHAHQYVLTHQPTGVRSVACPTRVAALADLRRRVDEHRQKNATP